MISSIAFKANDRSSLTSTPSGCSRSYRRRTDLSRFWVALLGECLAYSLRHLLRADLAGIALADCSSPQLSPTIPGRRFAPARDPRGDADGPAPRLPPDGGRRPARWARRARGFCDPPGIAHPAEPKKKMK